MEHIPFAALPAVERQALAEALLRSGVALRYVCVSRTVPGATGEEQGVATVSGAGWIRSYATDPGWLALLERDLHALAAAAPAQSGLPNRQGDME